MNKLLDTFKKVIHSKKKGFTLVELIVTLAIFTLLMGLMIGVLTPIMQANVNARDLVDAKSLLDSADQILEKTLQNQKGLLIGNDIGDESVEDYPGYVQTKGGRLVYISDTGEQDLLNESIYGRYDISVTFSSSKAAEMYDAVLVINMTVTERGGNYSSSRTVYMTMNNILLEKGNILFPTGNPKCTNAYLLKNK